MKTRTVVTFSVLACAFLAAAFSLAGDADRVADYEVHEWGVIAGCDGGGDYFLTSRPLQVVVVREPVLYFHSRDRQPFSLKVRFARGVPTLTYPSTRIKGDTVEWARVSFTEHAAGVTKGLRPETGHVPLEEILERLNDVDADEISYNGVRSRFLFYEGGMPFANNIACTIAPGGREAVVVNNGDYPVLDLFVIHAVAGALPFRDDHLFAYLPQLNAGEKVQVGLEPVRGRVDFAEPLRKLGFTAKEAESFEALWHDSFLEYGKLVYRLPGEECDKLIELRFDPRPKKIARALFVLVKR